MDRFSNLPKDLISEILSRTSPRDVCRSSVISRRFNSVANSDDMWGKFLPPDISKMVYQGVFTTTKELYFCLANSFVLLDNRALSLALNKASGERSFMLGTRELAIECRSYPVNWTCLSWLHSRFSEVADLERVPWFDITGKIEARLLSPQTTYVVYFVFRLRSRLCTLGLIPPKAKASIRFFDGERRDGGGDGDRHGHGNEITNIVSLGVQPSHSDGQFARYREDDEWMEIELGEFFNGQGDTSEIEMRLTAVEGGHWSYDIFVEGIELRPKVIKILNKSVRLFR
ncbi:hypothetical protein Vadar_034552 [Vaccinium darrowii]|uniref:Uncharacterized protein n=1 Tax=Vaccinium darrowii TaxID=229202 RepID=A0ACB7ZNQ8_9ERIC|nr:hypothetical protein Vadar_034552 [Vaccinium darrowii]